MFPPLSELAEALFWIMAVIAGVIIIVIVAILKSLTPKPIDEEIRKSHWEAAGIGRRLTAYLYVLVAAWRLKKNPLARGLSILLARVS